MLMPDLHSPPRSYKSYKAEQFNKKIEKMKTLIRSIDESSLKFDDKQTLKHKLKDLF